MRVSVFAMSNQNPEQIARDLIDEQLTACGWVIQAKSDIDLGVSLGIAVREYPTEVGPADYVLFVNRKPVGIIEAKRPEEAVRLTVHEEQSEYYANARLKYLSNDPLPFVYESTGDVTRFTDYRDPKPRSRPVFSFHKPETFERWLKNEKSVREGLLDIPTLPEENLRDCQITAINNLEASLKENRPRALVQMATGSGKTFTAITTIYRLLKHAKVNRVLFLVDTKNLGEQAEQEFMAYMPTDDNRKFTELYNVQRLKSSYVATDSQVCISTIQRLYSLLKGEELDESAEETNPNETSWEKRPQVPVAYNAKIPIEFFDVVVIDECHRSIYNLWKQVLEYFDSFLVGLTATPDNRTFGFFNQNIVSEYTHEQAVADGVNVGYNVFEIETDITRKGAVIWKGEYVDHREKLTRKKRWEQLDEDKTYTGKMLDRDVVNPSQIRMVIKTFKQHLPDMFPDRYDANGNFEVPKTLIFAKTDSHADDIIQIVREEFAEDNNFCRKITYKAEDDPKSVLSWFRNAYNPRIAVTVDMIATGTDVRPLECLLFMRDVRSRNYFEQMKGRGTRTITLDDLRKVTPTAHFTKDHFVIVDAVGVTKSLKTDSRPMEKKPGVPLKDLLEAVAVGARDEDLFTTLAGRLARLDKQLSEKEKTELEQIASKPLTALVKGLLNAYNPDTLDDIRIRIQEQNPGVAPADIEKIFNHEAEALQQQAAAPFTGKLNQYILKVHQLHSQIIDTINPDTLIHAGWDTQNREKAQTLTTGFEQWLQENKDTITALQIFYNQPYRRRELTYALIKEVLDTLKREQPALAPLQVWRAYEQTHTANGSPKNELVALVALIRLICGIDNSLTAYDQTVDRNFKQWVFAKQAGDAPKFTEEQMHWLRMIKEYIATSFHIEKDDFELSPFDAQGGLGKMWQLFGSHADELINELNEALVA